MLAILTPRDIGVKTSPTKRGEEHRQGDDGAATLVAMASSFRPRESSRGATLCTDGLAGHSAVRMRAAQRLPHLSACQAHRPICPSQLKCLTYWSHQVDTCATKQSDC